MNPNPMPTAAPLLCKHVSSSEGGDGVASCHGSVLECGEFGDRLIMVNLSELCCPYGSRDAHGVDHLRALIPGCAIVTVGDPDGLTVSEAGSRGESHCGRV